MTEQIIPEAAADIKVPILPYRSRPLLKIQDGCNLSCSFCIIPRVRGKSRSMPLKDILGRMKILADEDCREVVLTGIHICSYGQDLSPKTSFLDLLERLEGMDDLMKVRLSSLDPRLLSAPLLSHLVSSEKICPHFHLSLQHGSDRILSMMGRKSHVGEYKEILTYLHCHLPQASLGADIIVGFPGESEEDFLRMRDFLARSPLTYFHVFSYSPRPGTPASFRPQVEEKKKKERAALLRMLSRQKNLRFRRQFLERELDAVAVRNKKDSAEVLTSNYIKVSLPCGTLREGQAVRIRLVRTNDRETIGQVSGTRSHVSAGF
jgi:threonylcarbamoyladenosine tRNA methylthiotransferase MtaB